MPNPACKSSSLLSLYICVGLFFLMLMMHDVMYGGYVPKLFFGSGIKSVYIFYVYCIRKKEKKLEQFAAA